MESLSALRSKVQDVTRCPVDLSSSEVADSLREAILEYWLEFVMDWPEQKAGAFADPLMIETANRDELLHALDAWGRWGTSARMRFRENIAPLAELRMADRLVYPKHYPPSNWSQERIKSATLRRDSLLYPVATPHYQCVLLQETIAAQLDDFVKVEDRHLYIRAPDVVGACEGQDTDVLTYVLDFSTRIGHAYPTLEQQIARRPAYDAWPPHPGLG